MNKDEPTLQKFISDFRQEFMTLPFDDIAFPRGVKGLKDYRDSVNIYKKATPIQVKSALLFNHIIKEKNMSNVQPISDGDKIKFVYLNMPNPVRDSVIANADILPGIEQYIDRDMQFNKGFLDPLKSIIEIIDWESEQRSTLEDFFS